MQGGGRAAVSAPKRRPRLRWLLVLPWRHQERRRTCYLDTTTKGLLVQLAAVFTCRSTCPAAIAPMGAAQLA